MHSEIPSNHDQSPLWCFSKIFKLKRIRPISYVESWNAIQTIDNENTYSSRRRRMTEWILMLAVGVFSLDESYTILKCFLWISKIMHDCHLICASWLANMALLAYSRDLKIYNATNSTTRCLNFSLKIEFWPFYALIDVGIFFQETVAHCWFS